MRKAVVEVVCTTLVLSGLYAVLVVLQPGWQGAVLLGVAAFVSLAILTLTRTWYFPVAMSPRQRVLEVAGDALMISALVVFAVPDDGTWSLFAWGLLVASGVIAYKGRGSPTVEMNALTVGFAQKRTWIVAATIAIWGSGLVVVILQLPWWVTIIVSVVSVALIAYVLRGFWCVSSP